jgi:hypothetical protein
MDVVRDLRTPGGFSRENALPVTLAELGPEGDAWLRSTLVDGQTGAGSTIPNERADAQFGSFPLNTTTPERRYLRWYERFIEMPTTSLDRWQVIGPEVHGPNVSPFDQALVMMEVSPSKRRRLNANAGRSSARYFDLGPIEIGRVYLMEMDVILAADGRGRVRVRRDGGNWVGFDGEASIFQATGGSYWKEAHYRNAQINERSTYDISSMMLYEAALDEAIPGSTAPPPPPPPAGDTTPPRVEMVISNDGSFVLSFPDGDVHRTLSGIAGDPVPVQNHVDLDGFLTFDGEFDVSGLTAGQTYWAWTIAFDAAGNESPTPGRPFTPVATEPPPPPPPPPDDPCADIRNQLDAALDERDAARLERDAALAKITAAKAALA